MKAAKNDPDQTAVDVVKDQIAALAKRLPVVLQPAPLGTGGFGPVDFLMDYLSIAMAEDRDGKQVIRNARLFESAARIKTQLLNPGVSVRKDAVESQRLQDFLAAFLAQLSKRDPAFVNAVLVDIEDLAGRMGFAVDGLLN